MSLVKVLEATKALHSSNPFLSSFADWPEIFNLNEKSNVNIPATDLVKNFPLEGSQHTKKIVNVIKENTQFAKWQHTYTEEEVGIDFLNRYGYYELIGTEGHFQSANLRAFIAYWGEGLTYDWHSHEAEELYFVLAGSALFKTQRIEKILRANDSCYHRSWESHSMVTFSEPILTLVLWRGKGLEILSTMDKKVKKYNGLR